MSQLSFKPSQEMTFSTVKLDYERLLEYSNVMQLEILTLDLSEVIHCDSAGLTLLIEAKRLAREKNKQCKIKSMSKTIYALIEFCGVDTLILENDLRENELNG